MQRVDLYVVVVVFVAISSCPAVNSFVSERDWNITNIIGGDVAQPGSTPWLVSIRDNKVNPPLHFCGGTILSHNWILTAASCVTSYHIFELKIFLGEYDMQKDEGFESTRMPLRFIIHDKYDYYEGPEYNVALIYVDHIYFNERTRPAVLWPKYCDHHHMFLDGKRERSKPIKTARRKWDQDGDMGLVAGWGRKEDNQPSSVVREAKLTILSQESCKTMYSGFSMESIMCAANKTTMNVAACTWDEGGGLIDHEGHIIGLFSYTGECNSLPGLYINMSVIKDWLCPIIDHRFKPFVLNDI